MIGHAEVIKRILRRETRMTDEEIIVLSVATIELAKVAAELRRRGRVLEADQVAIKVALNAEILQRAGGMMT
jgi:hypothetical protein